MGQSHRYLALLALVACIPTEPVDRPGGQSGSLQVELDKPDDIADIDYEQAVQEAFRLALSADLAHPWGGHIELLAGSDGECPNFFLGAPEDANADDEDAMSWEGTCSSDDLDFSGFMTWTGAVDVEGNSASREVTGDAMMNDGGNLALAFDGDANDEVRWEENGGFTYTSTIEGQFSGDLIYGSGSEIPGGFRGASAISYTSEGQVIIDANLFLFGEPLMGRFDAIVLDVEFADDCMEEPIGYVGLRGTDGFWFDIYFLPRFAADDNSAVAYAYPYELIDNPTCDGCGNLFVRNVRADLPTLVCPDFSTVSETLTAPEVDEYIMTIHDLPWDRE